MPQRDPAKEQFWRRLLRQWRDSGLTGRDFCAEHRVSEPSFYAWRREIARRDQPRPARRQRPAAPAATAVFRQLALAANTTTPPAIEVVVAERRLLRVRPGFDADLLRQLVRLLEEPSC